MTEYYVLFIYGDVDPELIGPYVTADKRDEEAKEKRYQEGEEHGIFMLDIDDSFNPHVSAYSGTFFNECPMCGSEVDPDTRHCTKCREVV